MINRKFDALPSPPDPRDYRFEDIGGAAVQVKPYHSNYVDVIIDQLYSSHCLACAIIAARAEQEFMQTGGRYELSQTTIYGKDYDLDGEGMYGRTGMRIAKAGIPYVTEWESWEDKPVCRELVKQHENEAEFIKQSKLLRLSSYYRGSNSWAEVCNAARSTYGGAILLVAVHENWLDIGSDGVVGPDKGKYLGNHFIRVKDYEILPNGTYKVRFQNSYGADWGDGGYGYFYSDKNSFMELWVMVDNVDEVVHRLFEDVADDNWAREAIERCAKEGVLAGFEDGTFRPEEYITRGQAAMIAYKLLKKMEELK